MTLNENFRESQTTISWMVKTITGQNVQKGNGNGEKFFDKHFRKGWNYSTYIQSYKTRFS